MIRYVFTAPEALDETKWKALLLETKFTGRLRAFFFDEVHCIETWGSGTNPFRHHYSKLATLHSFVPSTVPFVSTFVALMATASESTRMEICKSLEMVSTCIVAISPNRLNIRYSVYSVSKDLELRFTWFLEELRCNQVSMVKTIVFCRSIASCSELYSFFDYSLKDDGYVFKVAKLENALFGMYHAKITDTEKSTHIKSFSEARGSCRVLFSTIVFGMGGDIPDIRHIIHNGPPDSIENYIQESGSGGRDGLQCEAVLYMYAGATRGHVCSEMKEYGSNLNKCRCVVAMSHFPGTICSPKPQHLCCDICSQQCLCHCMYCICNCIPPSVPCSFCCTCEVKCLYLTSFDIVMPMRLMNLAERDSSSAEDN